MSALMERETLFFSVSMSMILASTSWPTVRTLLMLVNLSVEIWDAPEKLTDMQCLPPSLVDRIYYRPTEQGVEGKFKTRLEQIKTWKKQHRANTKAPQDQQLKNDEHTKNDVHTKKT